MARPLPNHDVGAPADHGAAFLLENSQPRLSDAGRERAENQKCLRVFRKCGQGYARSIAISEVPQKIGVN